MKPRIAVGLGAMLLAVTLGGCLGHSAPAPTDHDVAQAVRALVLANDAPSSAAYAAAPRERPDVAVKNLGCNPAPDYKGYLCETHIDVRQPGRAAVRHVRLVRMMRTADGWHATMQ